MVSAEGQASPVGSPPRSPDSLSGPRFSLSQASAQQQSASGPLPGPGETLVGVVDSLWPLANPRGLFPGDILLRLGRRGQTGTLRAPFPDGLTSVRQWVARRARTEDAVLVQVLRGSSKLELAVSLSRSRTGGSSEAEGEGSGVLQGVVLAEGKHANFAPLAARTEHNILRLERMKAYGLTLGPPSPRDAGREGHSTKEGNGETAQRTVQMASPAEEGDGTGDAAPAGNQRSSLGSGLQAGSLLSVAAGVLPSDPLLEPDDDDLCTIDAGAHSFEFRFDRLHVDDTNCSMGSADTSLHADLLSGPLGHSTQSAPGTAGAPGSYCLPRGDDREGDGGDGGDGGGESPEETEAVRGGDSALFRLYTRPNSPRKGLVRHSSQPDMLVAPPTAALQHQLSGSPPRATTPAPSFQIRRRSIPEAVPAKAGKDSLSQRPASLFTILVLPSESTTGSRPRKDGPGAGLHRRFSDVNNTVERATRWFQGVKSSGVAFDLMSAQTEVLPLRLGGMDSAKLVKVAQYGKWIVKTGDSARGDHVSVLRAVRLWLVPASEVELTLCLSSRDDSCPDWGIQLAQTSQGVVHVASVAPGSAADKAGVHMLLRMAEGKKQVLAVTKIQSHVLIPTMISDDGIDCVDVAAIHEQLLLHAHLQSPLQLTLAL